MTNGKTVHTEISINAEIEKVWDTLYNRFGEIADFNPNLIGSHHTNGKQGVGCERQCNLDSKTFVRERIAKADPLKSLTIDIYDGNMPMVKSMVVEMQLATKGKSTVVKIAATYQTKPAFMAGLIKGMFTSKFEDLLIGLKYFMETGRKVTKSTFKPIRKEFKRFEVQHSFAA